METNSSQNISLSLAEWLNRLLIALGLKTNTKAFLEKSTSIMASSSLPPKYVDPSTENSFSVSPEEAGLTGFVNDNNDTIFHLAARNGDFEIMKTLCENFEEEYDAIALESILNTQNKKGETALHVNCYTNTGIYHNHPVDNLKAGEEIAKLLITKGADVNATAIRDDKLTTVELLARFKYSIETFKLLISSGAELGNAINIVKYLSEMFDSNGVRNYRLEVVELLIEKGLIKNTDRDALIYQICNGHSYFKNNSRTKIEILMNLYSKLGGSKTDFVNNNRVLHLLTDSQDINLIKEICATPGVDLTVKDSNRYSLLFRAAQDGNLEFVKFLVKECGIDPNETSSREGETALYAASQHGHLEIVKFLIKHNANPNIACIRGTTPLDRAAMNNNMTCVELLVANGAKKCNGDSIYQLVSRATKKMDKKLIIFVTEKLGVNINLVNDYGYSPLFRVLENMIIRTGGHANCCGGNKKSCELIEQIQDFAKFLISKGADINCQPTKYTVYHEIGDTLLHMACGNGDLEAVKFFISLGIDHSLQNSKGQTAMDIAKEKGHKCIIDYLSPPSCDMLTTEVQRTKTLLKK